MNIDEIKVRVKYLMAVDAVIDLRRTKRGVLSDKQWFPMSATEIKNATGYDVKYLIDVGILSSPKDGVFVTSR